MLWEKEKEKYTRGYYTLGCYISSNQLHQISESIRIERINKKIYVDILKKRRKRNR